MLQSLSLLPETSRRMAKVRQKGTSAEVALRQEMYRIGLRYRIDYEVLKKPRRVADIAFPGRKIAIFVDGCFWHGCPEHATWPKRNAEFWRKKIEENRRRDADTNDRLRSLGWTVLRFWSHESPIEAAKTIASMVAMIDSKHCISSSIPNVEISGPFLAIPVLKEVFPQGLEELDTAKRKRLRQPSLDFDATPANEDLHLNATEPRADYRADPAHAIIEHLKAHPGWHSKSDILAATGITGGQWSAAIANLIASGKVERQGERRGARYRIQPGHGSNTHEGTL